jgi:hypothetical protein
LPPKRSPSVATAALAAPISTGMLLRQWSSITGLLVSGPVRAVGRQASGLPRSLSQKPSRLRDGSSRLVSHRLLWRRRLRRGRKRDLRPRAKQQRRAAHPRGNDTTRYGGGSRRLSTPRLAGRKDARLHATRPHTDAARVSLRAWCGSSANAWPCTTSLIRVAVSPLRRSPYICINNGDSARDRSWVRKGWRGSF